MNPSGGKRPAISTNQRESTMNKAVTKITRLTGELLGGAAFTAALIILLGAWPLNLVRFIQCDFSSEGTFKGEVLHGMGIFTPICLITAWSDWDEE